MATYGATEPKIKRGETEEFADNVDTLKPVISLGMCCILLPMLIIGVVILSYSRTVPSKCSTNLHAVFLTLGVLDISIAVMGCCAVGCMGNKISDIYKHSVLQQHYEEGQRDAEAQKEEQAIQGDMMALGIRGCPLICGICLATLASLVCWIWGITEAATDDHGTCGSSPRTFWILLAVVFVLRVCGPGLSVIGEPA